MEVIQQITVVVMYGAGLIVVIGLLTTKKD